MLRRGPNYDDAPTMASVHTQGRRDWREDGRTEGRVTKNSISHVVVRRMGHPIAGVEQLSTESTHPHSSGPQRRRCGEPREDTPRGDTRRTTVSWGRRARVSNRRVRCMSRLVLVRFRFAIRRWRPTDLDEGGGGDGGAPGSSLAPGPASPCPVCVSVSVRCPRWSSVAHSLVVVSAEETDDDERRRRKAKRKQPRPKRDQPDRRNQRHTKRHRAGQPGAWARTRVRARSLPSRCAERPSTAPSPRPGAEEFPPKGGG